VRLQTGSEAGGGVSGGNVDGTALARIAGRQH
jgi:hypothetical protein